MSSLSSKPAFGLGILVVFSLLIGTLVYFQMDSAKRSRDRVMHTYIVMAQIDRLLLALTDAESSQRGFSVNGSEEYLVPYKQVTQGDVLDRHLATLNGLVQDNASQEKRIVLLRKAIRDKLTYMAEAIRRTRLSLEEGRDFLRDRQGVFLMAHVRALLDAMMAEETRLLAQRTAHDDEIGRHNAYLALILAFVLIGVMFSLFIAIQREFNRRRRVEKALSDTTAFQSAVLDTSIYTIIATDTDGVIRMFNPAAEDMLGYRAEEVIGKKTPEILHDPEETRQRADELSHELNQPIAPGFEVFVKKPTLFGAEEREWTYICKDGTRIDVLLGVTALRDENGAITGYLGISKDITQRKKAEAELRRSEAFNRSLMEASADCVKVLGLDGRIWRMNSPGLSLMDIDDFETVRGKEWWTLWPKETEREVRRAVGAGAVGGQCRFQAPCPTAKGHSRWWDVQVSPVFDSNGHVMHILVVSRDITAGKEVERMKNEFISTVSHELRTPLTSIRGSLGLILCDMAGELGAEAAPLVQIAYNNSERLTRLINNILDIEKMESGTIVFASKPVPVGALLVQALAENQGFAGEYKVRLRLEDKAPDAVVKADADRLMQVVTNLLSNAIKFSDEGGEVVLACERDREQIRIAVSDRGAGIPDAFKSRIFGRFAQADSSNTRQKGGTGLGLSITKAIVESMGGSIGFRSRPGETVFHFTLPESVTAALPPTVKRAEPKKILIVEDDRDIATLLQMILEKEGFACVHAGSADLARQRLAEQSFAAVTIDLGLPDEDGMSFIRSLRASATTMQVPVIVISAQADEGCTRLDGDAFGVIDWLTKPIDTDRLKRALSGIVRSGGLPHILHVEDEPDIVDVIAFALRGVAHITPASTLAQARAELRAGVFDLVILDVQMPDGDGLDLLAVLNERVVPVPVIILSASQVSRSFQARVAASMVKSVVSEEKIVQTIKSFIERRAV